MRNGTYYLKPIPYLALQTSISQPKLSALLPQVGNFDVLNASLVITTCLFSGMCKTHRLLHCLQDLLEHSFNARLVDLPSRLGRENSTKRHGTDENRENECGGMYCEKLRLFK